MKGWYFVIIIFLASCQSEAVYTPKPRLFPRIDFPERSYTAFNEEYCSFTFDMPAYGRVVRDSAFFEEDPLDPCWFDILLPPFNGRIHFSYFPVENRERYDDLVKDAFTFVEKHDIKANYRSETPVSNTFGAGGIFFEIDGPVATPAQFFMTDTTDHFLRASLYFNNVVAPDSMEVVHEWVKKDITRILSSLEFKD